MKLSKLMAMLAATVAMGTAQASIIDHGAYTTDTVSGLDWLDVTRTVGMSYNAVLSELAVGGTLYGWRYATTSQLAELVYGLPGDYTIVFNSARVTGADMLPFDGLMTSLGITFSNPIYTVHDRVVGLTANTFSPVYHYYSAFESVYDNYYGTRYSELKFNDGWRHNTLSDGSIGSFLVRDTAISPVPAPPAFILMLVGLGMLGLTKRFRKEV